MTGILTNALGFYSSYCLLVFLEFLGVAAGYSFSLFLILHLSEVPLKYKTARRRAMRCCAGLGPSGRSPPTLPDPSRRWRTYYP